MLGKLYVQVIRRQILELRGVSRRFPGTIAVDHVSFSARAGEITGYLGLAARSELPSKCAHGSILYLRSRNQSRRRCFTGIHSGSRISWRTKGWRTACPRNRRWPRDWCRENGSRRVLTYGTAKPDSVFEIGSISKRSQACCWRKWWQGEGATG